MSLRLKPQPDADPNVYFYVYDDAEGFAGRIFDCTQTSPPKCEAPWFWGLDYFKARGLLPYYGQAASKDEARAKFRKTWDSRGPK